jgi:hypothetical protein
VSLEELGQLLLVEDVVEPDADVLGADDADRVLGRPEQRIRADVAAEEEPDPVDADDAPCRGAGPHLLVADVPCVLVDA